MVTVAVVSIILGLQPTLANSYVRLMEKLPAWAAAISSGALVDLLFPSLPKEYGILFSKAHGIEMAPFPGWWVPADRRMHRG